MKTIYIDVYFLINFTVDMLALYFASFFSKTPTTTLRLLLSSLVGALYAVGSVLFFEERIISVCLSVVIFILMVAIITKGIGFYRKLKYSAAFFFFQIIIGGFVYYGYCLLDRVFIESEFLPVGERRGNLLILSLIVLLSIGILKIILSVFSNIRAEKAVKLSIVYEGREIAFDAFVDSGNLAQDPFDKTPVMFILPSLAIDIFGTDVFDTQSDNYEMKKKIRVIPINRQGKNIIVFGIKPEYVYVKSKKRREPISLVIAIDKEGTSYDGYPALVPLSALDGVLL